MKNKGKNNSLSIPNGKISNNFSNSAPKEYFEDRKAKYLIINL